MFRRIVTAALLLAASVCSQAAPSADLFATVTPGPVGSPGGTQTYTLTIVNNGPDDAQSAAFTFDTPLNTALQSFTQDSGPAMTLNAPLGGNGTFSGSIATFPAGATAQFTVVIGLDPAISNAVTVHLNVSATTIDPDLSNNDSQPLVNLDTSYDIAVSASGTATAVAGSSLTDLFTIINSGPSSAQNVTVTFDTTGSLTYGGTSPTGGAASTINSEPTLGTSGTVSITIPLMLSGESASFSVVLSVNPLTTGSTTVTFQASATNDINGGNNSVPVTNTITTASDMGVAISGPTTGTAGGTVIYTITLTNAGPSNADTVSFTDTLPAGMTVVSFIQDLSAANVLTPSMGFSQTASTATATVGFFAAGGSATWVLTASIAPGFAGSLTNTGTITSLTAEPAPLNNSASTTLTVPGVNSFNGPSLGAIPGTITATFTGGGVGCTYSAPQFIGAPPGSPPVPPTTPSPGVVFPFGMFDFSLTGCTSGSTVSFTITYPQPVPPGTRYWKYGPTSSDHMPHWYVLPAAISGNTVTFSITDGGLGDDDLLANGAIVDQGGPGAGGSAAIPALSDALRFGLALLVVLLGAASLRRRFA